MFMTMERATEFHPGQNGGSERRGIRHRPNCVEPGAKYNAQHPSPEQWSPIRLAYGMSVDGHPARMTTTSDALSLQIRLFGALEIVPANEPRQLTPRQSHDGATESREPGAPSSPTAQSLLAYLILRRSQAVSRDRLAGLFWSERSSRRARRSLSHTLWQIRQALGPAEDRLVTAGDTVGFVVRVDDWLDTAVFEEKAKRHTGARSGSALSVGPAADLSTRLLDLEDAVTLYRGDFLEGIYEDWALVERERLREVYLHVLDELLTLYKRSGDYKHALSYAQRLAAADPLREAAHRELMRLYHLIGRPRAALTQFSALCDVLAEELGAAPAPATVALCRSIATSHDDIQPPNLPCPPPPPPLLTDLAHLPFVGRARERSTLMGALQAVSQGRGETVLVEGEPGVGKTRLINEIVAGARWRGFQVAMSKADSLVAPAPLQLLRDALLPLLTPLRTAQLSKLVDPLQLATAAAALPPVTKHVPELPEIPPLSPRAEQQRLFQGIAHCLIGLASIAPLLVVLEDVHWADETTLEGLPELLTGIRGSPVLVILSCRTAEARLRQVVWDALDALDQASLIHRQRVKPFSPVEAVSLIQRALGSHQEDGDAVEFGRRLQHDTGGNPLFIVESLESLLEQGLLSRSDGDWNFPAEDRSLPRPASLQDLVRKRVSGLPVDDQAVLELVAVLGEEGDFQVLSRAARGEPAELTRRLRRIEEAGFLTETNTGYTYQHDVIRDVVYQAIPAYRRKVLHCRVGTVLEDLWPDNIGALAYHFERGEVWAKAVRLCRRAGQRARAVYAGAQSIDYYDRALSAWRRLDEDDRHLGLCLYRERGRIHQDLGQFSDAEADFRMAEGLARLVGEKKSLARIMNHLSYLSFQRGDFEQALGVSGQALDLGRELSHAPVLAAALFNQANALRNLGRYEEAIDAYEGAVVRFEGLHDDRHLADCLNRMGAALNHIGAFVRGRALMERSLSIRRRLQDKMGISYSLINLAASHYYAGQFFSMREAAREALEIATEIEDPYGQDAALHGLAAAALEQGRAAEAIPLYQRALTIAREIGDKAIEPEVLAGMGRSYEQLGDLDRAQVLLKESLSAVPVSVQQDYVAPLHAHLAALYLAVGQLDLALFHARSGVVEAETRRDRWATGLTRRVMAQVISRIGALDGGEDAVDHFERSTRMLRRIGAEAELARGLAAHGTHLLRLGGNESDQRGGKLLREARILFERLGMAADLARLDADPGGGIDSQQICVRLAAASAPTGRSLRKDEYVEIVWTISAPDDDEIGNQSGSERHRSIAQRRHRIQRLLKEAAEQSGVPTVADLADVLGVSDRTIKRDLAVLRAEGLDVRTYGRQQRS